MKVLWAVTGVSLVGVCVGVLSGLLGVGGGSLMIPAILYLWPTADPTHDMQRAVATSLAVMAPAAFMGAFRHALYGNVDWKIFAGMAAGAVVGTFFLGAPLAHYLPASVLKKLFGAVLVFFGLQVAGVFDLIGKH